MRVPTSSPINIIGIKAIEIPYTDLHFIHRHYCVAKKYKVFNIGTLSIKFGDCGTS